MNTTFRRYLQFNLVGASGVVVQLAALAGFSRLLPGHTLVATALAVEIALLQNFFWHARFTWRDRTFVPGLDPGLAPARATPRARQLLRFHLSNGVVSLAGNLGVMALLVRGAHLPALPANAIAIAGCSALNFALSHRWAFAADDALPARGRSVTLTLVVLFGCLLPAAGASAQTTPLPEGAQAASAAQGEAPPQSLPSAPSLPAAPPPRRQPGGYYSRPPGSSAARVRARRRSRRSPPWAAARASICCWCRSFLKSG